MPPRPNAAPNEILITTLQLIAEHDVSGVSVDMVAEKAGVSKATIYRRWASRSDLIAEAMTLTRRPGVNPDTGSLRDDLIMLLRELVDFLNRPDGGRVFIAFLNAAIRDPKLAAIQRAASRDAHGAYKKVIDRAVARGELSADVDIRFVTDLLISPFLYNRMVDNQPVRKGDIPRIVEVVLAGLGVKQVKPEKGRASAARKQAS